MGLAVDEQEIWEQSSDPGELLFVPWPSTTLGSPTKRTSEQLAESVSRVNY
jgi:hypothetical protein